jgi:hypothetical protein
VDGASFVSVTLERGYELKSRTLVYRGAKRAP